MPTRQTNKTASTKRFVNKRPKGTPRTIPVEFEQPIDLAVTIGVPRESVFEFLSDLDNLDLFMKSGKVDFEITEERKGKMLAWAATTEEGVETNGKIWLIEAPQERGTILGLELEDDEIKPLAFLNLRRLKCYLETGEIATIDGQTSGRDESATLIQKH